MSKTTVNLQLPPRRYWFDLSTPVCAALCVFLLLLIGLVVGRVQSLRQQAVPTPALAIIYVATSTPMPTAPLPTPDTRVLEELAALREQVAQLQAQQAAPPEVVYQPVYVPQAQPAYQEAPVYQTAPEPAAAPTPPPAAPEMQPQTAAILDRGAWASQAATAQAQR